MMKNEEKAGKTRYIHRVGTITFGVVLVMFGCLFLMHLFWPSIDYLTIFHLWPCIFIFLGIEVLTASRDESQAFMYDKTAVFLLVILTIFAMGMAAADCALPHCIPEIVIW